jgi:shikimate kinase
VKILLLGLPGAGTTTVGSLLGSRLERPFLDAPALVERTGSGSKALTLLLAMPGDLIAVVPPEVFEDPVDVGRLQTADAHVVWLRCSHGVLVRRIGSRLGPDVAPLLRRLALERNDVYSSVAAQVVDTDTMPAGQSANVIIDEARARSA